MPKGTALHSILRPATSMAASCLFPPRHVGFVALESKPIRGCPAIPAPYSRHQAPQRVPCCYYHHTAASTVIYGRALGFDCVLLLLHSTCSCYMLPSVCLSGPGCVLPGKKHCTYNPHSTALVACCALRSICFNPPGWGVDWHELGSQSVIVPTSA
jgi:hypothetical protein